MNELLKKKFEYLGTGTTKEHLIDVLDYVKNRVADVRTKVGVRAEIENDVRRGIIQVIDEFIVANLKTNVVNTEKEDYS